MKKKDLLRRLREGKKLKPEPIKVKLDFDVDQDGAPDHYKTGNKHTNKQNNKTPDFFSHNFNDEKTNVRPLHKPEKKYKSNSKSGDDHLTVGANFEVEESELPSVGHSKWSGDDHIFEIIDEISSKILVEKAFRKNKKYLLKKKL